MASIQDGAAKAARRIKSELIGNPKIHIDRIASIIAIETRSDIDLARKDEADKTRAEIESADGNLLRRAVEALEQIALTLPKLISAEAFLIEENHRLRKKDRDRWSRDLATFMRKRPAQRKK